MFSNVKNILVVSASIGSGHTVAAEALRDKLFMSRDVEVSHIDILEYANPIFKWSYRNLYLKMQDWMPHTLGLLYDVLDKPKAFVDLILSKTERVSLRKFRKLLLSRKWDAIVSTHFLAPKIVSWLRIDVPQYIIVTDYAVHRFWFNTVNDIYFVPTEEGSIRLNKWGVAIDNIEVSGIPVRSRFSEKYDKPPFPANILLIGGGNGVGSLESIFNQIKGMSMPFGLNVVCGKNKTLEENLKNRSLDKVVNIYGFTDRVDQLMKDAHLIVTKPGGLTVSEALASNTPMALIGSTFGQEDRNATFVLEQGAGIKLESSNTVDWKIQNLLMNRTRYDKMACRAKVLGYTIRGATDFITNYILKRI